MTRRAPRSGAKPPPAPAGAELLSPPRELALRVGGPRPPREGRGPCKLARGDPQPKAPPGAAAGASGPAGAPHTMRRRD